jgi:hypothetical protein
MPRTVVLGLKRGLGYRGVLVARELDGGAGWEGVSLRIGREKDDEAVTALLEAAGIETARRGGRTLFLRYAEGSPHRDAVRRAVIMPYRLERLYMLPPRHFEDEFTTSFRPAARSDRQGIFRLYCRTVPEHIRRHEAPTQQEWRAVLDSYDCERSFVLDGDGAIAAWVGFGDREARVMADFSIEGLADAALDLIEAEGPRHGSLVLGADQGQFEQFALRREYTPLGARLLGARRLAALNPLKEVVTVAASVALPQ